MSEEVLCKLTDRDMRTHGGFQWILGEWAPELSGEGELCGPGYYHCYTHPLLAGLLNSIHACIYNPRIFRIEVAGKSLDDSGLKRGYTRMKPVEEINLPEVTLTQRIAFALLCALQVYRAPDFVIFANNWLSGQDRSVITAEEAAYAVWADEVAEAAGVAACAAARVAACAAAATAVDASWDAARAAAWATEVSADRSVPLDLIAMALKAMAY